MVRFTTAFALSISLFFAACKKESTDIHLGSNVERIALLLDYEVGYGGYIYPVHNPYVFFKDGTVVKEPKIPIEDLQLGALTKKEAVDWGTYKKAGDKVVITYYDGDQSEKEWPGAEAYPAGKNETLAGSFSSISGGGDLAVGGSVGVIAYSNMTLTSDGWFTNERLGGGHSSDHSAFSQQKTAGQYTLDGYSITLKFNNGDTQRFFFCYYGQDRSVFRLSGRTYTE